MCQGQLAFDWQLNCLEVVGHLGRMGQMACPFTVGLGSPSFMSQSCSTDAPMGPCPARVCLWVCI